jgi:hypothetical protein
MAWLDAKCVLATKGRTSLSGARLSIELFALAHGLNPGSTCVKG